MVFFAEIKLLSERLLSLIGWFAEILPCHRHVELLVGDCLVEHRCVARLLRIEQVAHRLSRIAATVEVG